MKHQSDGVSGDTGVSVGEHMRKSLPPLQSHQLLESGLLSDITFRGMVRGGGEGISQWTLARAHKYPLRFLNIYCDQTTCGDHFKVTFTSNGREPPWEAVLQSRDWEGQGRFKEHPTHNSLKPFDWVLTRFRYYGRGWRQRQVSHQVEAPQKNTKPYNP